MSIVVTLTAGAGGTSTVFSCEGCDQQYPVPPDDGRVVLSALTATFVAAHVSCQRLHELPAAAASGRSADT